MQSRFRQAETGFCGERSVFADKEPDFGTGLALTPRMKTSSTQTGTSEKRSTVDADRARKIAFQELFNRAAEEAKTARTRRRAEKYKQWQGAAKRFKGLSEALRLRIESRNIHAKEDGYVVSFMRRGETFARNFSGITDESLSAAIKFRDEALKVLGENRHSVPAHVLKALGLSAPVPGISRNAAGSAYCLSRENSKRADMPQEFPFEFLKEEDAYAAAIECVEACLKSK
jgi:hypothetical protein